jgi:hypothetical protein
LSQGLESPGAEAFVPDGDILCRRLADAVHYEVDAGLDLEPATRGFMRFGGQNFGTAAFGRRVRQAGFSTEDSIAAIRSGEWDPFADVVFLDNSPCFMPGNCRDQAALSVKDAPTSSFGIVSRSA